MEKLIKLFPLKVAEKDTKALILALLFYFFVPGIVGTVVGFVLGLTIILAPVAAIVGIVLFAYEVVGIIAAIMGYMGKDFFAMIFKKSDAVEGEKVEE